MTNEIYRMTEQEPTLIWDKLGELTVGAPQEFWDKLLVHPAIIEAYNNREKAEEKESL